MKKGWLTRAGAFKVEHVPMPRPGQPVDLRHPPLGLLHTTQGSTIEGALAAYKTGVKCPTFTVGVDAKHRVRILQHVPLGEMAAGLENHAGGVETNREVRAQIEIVGFANAKHAWLPEPKTLAALVAVVAELEHAAGIPPHRAIVARNPHLWQSATGWCGHIDAPENAHWDPGKLNYRRLFQLVLAVDEIGRPVRVKPRKKIPVGKTARLRRRAAKTPPHPLCVVPA